MNSFADQTSHPASCFQILLENSLINLFIFKHLYPALSGYTACHGSQQFQNKLKFSLISIRTNVTEQISVVRKENSDTIALQQKS